MENQKGYKKTEIGWIPEDWNAVKIGAAVDKIVGGGTPSRERRDYYDGDIPWITVKDLSKNSFYKDSAIESISEEGLKNSSANLIDENNIIIATRMGLGRGFINTCDLAINQDMKALYLDKNILSNEFFLSWYLNNSDFIESLGTGTTVKGISLITVKNLSLPIPPLPEQKKIASILTAVDDKISSIDHQIQQTEQLKKGLMEKLLTEGIGHTEFKETKIGRIPKGWGCLTLAEAEIEIVDGDRGVNYPKQDDFLLDGFCLFLTAKNVSKIGFRFDENQYISEERDGLLRKGKLIRDDIVITTRGTVGNIAWYNDDIEFKNVRINSGMALIRKTQENFSSLFLYLLLRSHLVQKQVKLIAFGSAQPQLTIKEIKKFRVVLPSLEEQKQIATILSTVDDKIEVMNQKKNQYQTLKKGLSQQLLTGQMRVKI